MKSFIFVSIILVFAVLIVSSVVFRDERAREILRFIHRALFLYVIVVLVLAAWRIYQHGF